MKKRKHVKTQLSFEQWHKLHGFDEELHLDTIVINQDKRLIEMYLSADADAYPHYIKTHELKDGASTPSDSLPLEIFIEKMEQTLIEFKETVSKSYKKVLPGWSKQRRD